MRTIRSGRGQVCPAPRWPGVAAVGPVLLLAAVLMPLTNVAAGDARSSPGPASLAVIAEGSFGRVEGVPGAADREPDTDVLPVLDAWAMGTHIRFDPSEGMLAPWRVTAIPQPAGSGAAQQLGAGDGDADVTLDSPGLFLIRLDGTIRPDGGAHEGSWWWRVAVPDRTLPPDETGPPPPGLRLASGDDVVVLEQGSGCFLGTCGDIGRISPPDLLPTLRTIPGAPLSLTLADGSGMDGWTIEVMPIEGGGTDGLVLGRAPETWATHGWAPAPGVGDWVLAASVTFDRERGAFDGYARLIVAPSGG